MRGCTERLDDFNVYRNLDGVEGAGASDGQPRLDDEIEMEQSIRLDTVTSADGDGRDVENVILFGNEVAQVDGFGKTVVGLLFTFELGYRPFHVEASRSQIICFLSALVKYIGYNGHDCKGVDAMRTAGIVVEYNPLHNGHLHHLKETRRKSGAECVIAVMSGHVMQRGQFSLADKFTRTKWALEAGVDLVVELPAVFTAQNADVFAYKSIEILDRLEVEAVVFGCESGKVDPLNTVALLMESDAYHEYIKTFLSQGFSYPTSSDKALSLLTDMDVHRQPNNILGIQYIRAIRALKSAIEPLTVERLGTGYHDMDASGGIRSATSIRARHAQGEPFSAYVPKYVAQDLAKTTPIDWEDFYPFLAYALSTHDAETLNTVFGFDEGLENRVLNAGVPTSFASLLERVSTPRYTTSRLMRCFMHALIGTKKSLVENARLPYIRVLGMRSAGQRHLNRIKHTVDVPIVTKLSSERPTLLEHELKTTRVYDLVKRNGLLEREFEPVMMH